MPTLVLSCEHAVCSVPEWHRERFKGADEVLTSHRGWEPGALNLAQAFAMGFRTPLIHGEITRLLIDLNRPPEHAERFSEFVNALSEDQLRKLHERYFVSYLDALRQRIDSGIKLSPPAVHLSIHTSHHDPGNGGGDPHVKVSFDPQRPTESAVARQWIGALRSEASDLRVAEGDPTNNLAGLLRDQYPDNEYLGLGLEVDQSFFLAGTPWRWNRVKKLLLDTFGHE